MWVVVADHFEPYWRNSDDGRRRRARTPSGGALWPEIATGHADSSGRPPLYTFFYPEEEYRPELMDELAEMVRGGVADVEVHLHHDGEGEANFVDRMSSFRDTLAARHGLLREHAGRLVFGFIHGNWALDNARPDGRWCGLNNEISLLARLGCYADFTLPCVPSPAQAGPVNCVYWATDDPDRPRSHDAGVPVVPAGRPHRRPPDDPRATRTRTGRVGASGARASRPGELAANWLPSGRIASASGSSTRPGSPTTPSSSSSPTAPRSAIPPLSWAIGWPGAN